LNWGKAGLVILPFFLLVATLPAIELASPGEKPPETTKSLLELLDENFFFEKSGLSRQEVEGFLENPDALLISGHGLYPRYYSYDQGEPILPGQITPYTPREFPRLVFTLLLPDAERTVVLPIDEPRLNFPDAAEVIVGGCQVGQRYPYPILIILTQHLSLFWMRPRLSMFVSRKRPWPARYASRYATITVIAIDTVFPMKGCWIWMRACVRTLASKSRYLPRKSSN
jgi:hypothetical protein